MVRRRRHGGLRALGDLVPSVYPAREPEALRAARAFAWWDRIVPPRVADNARPVRLVRGVLTVHVATSAWASELEFLRANLLESVQEKAPRARVRDLRFRVGPLPARLRRDRPPPPPRRIPARELPEELARELAAVRDDDLRCIIRDAASYALGEDEAPPPPRRGRGGRHGT